MIPGHIFREYDIRGLHETELTNETAEAVGHAFATRIRAEGGTRVALGQDVRPSALERVEIREELRLILAGELAERRLPLLDPLDDLVLHIRDVHHVLQREAASAQPPAQHVGEDEAAEVADVGEVIDGWPAGVHADDVVLGGKRLDLLGQRVIEAKRHCG